MQTITNNNVYTNKKPLIQKVQLAEVGQVLDNQRLQQQSSQNNHLNPNHTPKKMVSNHIVKPIELNKLVEINKLTEKTKPLEMHKPINIMGFREEFLKLDKYKQDILIEIVFNDEYKNPHYIQKDDMYSRLLTELMLVIKTSKKPSRNDTESTFKTVCFMDQIEMYYLILGKNILDKKYQMPSVKLDVLAQCREQGKLVYMHPNHRIPDKASVDYYRACLSYLRTMKKK